MYVVWKEPEAAVEDLRERLLEDVGPALLRLTAGEVVVNVADTGAAFGGAPPEVAAANAAALLSFWLDDLDDRTAAEKEIAPLGARHSGFLVDQAIPRDYDRRTWPDGARTPGAKLLSLFPKPARLSDEQFFGHWFGSHTPLSLEVHPLWRYVRNVVESPAHPGGAAVPRHRRGAVPGPRGPDRSDALLRWRREPVAGAGGRARFPRHRQRGEQRHERVHPAQLNGGRLA